MRHFLIHTGQFGEPGEECQDAAFSKVLTNLVSQFSRTPVAQFESDATACFDREIMNFVSLCFHSTGAPMAPLQMWEQTLCHIVHRVKTAYGLSSGCYEYSPDSPIHGPGQGSKGGPGSCSTITSALIEAMYRLSNGLTLFHPSQAHSHSSNVKMFIDDSSNSTGKCLRWLHEPPTPLEVTELLRHDAQTWECLLWTLGGLLNLTTCLFYVAFWRFDTEGRASLTTKSELPPLLLSSSHSIQLRPSPQVFRESHGSYISNEDSICEFAGLVK
jgi:hypothetical protein